MAHCCTAAKAALVPRMNPRENRALYAHVHQATKCASRHSRLHKLTLEFRRHLRTPILQMQPTSEAAQADTGV
eukprot:1159257-Pelagomonas_calceolata.AAC.3